ncbi:GntR family transcriptional regulator, partial [Variovorax sp. E3]|uniref:GntR family transcriptional regulator n=1 Tax=Variovorax sp. E3 TaxID=1914993 RepID=UPI0018DDC9A4
MVPRHTLSPSALLESPLVKDRDAGSMQRQLYDRLKRAVLDGSLAPGSRLPGSRALAEALGISRNTVTATYEHLAAEGYVQPDRQGTRVTELSRPCCRCRCSPGARASRPACRRPPRCAWRRSSRSARAPAP